MKTTIFPLIFLWIANVCECGSLRSQSLSTAEEKTRDSQSYVFMESIPGLQTRDDLKKLNRAASDHVHEVVFVIQQRNIPELERILNDLSNPTSANYGQHLTRDDVIEMTSNTGSRDAVVDFLRSNGAAVVSETIGHEYITATAPVGVWEKLFNTEFFSYYLTEQAGRSRELIRTDSYWIPMELDPHVATVLNIVDIQYEEPDVHDMRQVKHDYDGPVSPKRIRRIYNMDRAAAGSQLSTQKTFISYPAHRNLVSRREDVAAGHKLRADDCADCILNFQYMSNVSPESPLALTALNSFWRDWLLSIANTTDLPLVIHINVGTDESTITRGIHDAFTVQAIKLGAMGITLIGPSGDDGALGRDFKRSGSSSCGYVPDFPSGNPYVTSVGATVVRTYLHITF
jgi:tripeptidyl-peptidase I